MIYNGDALKVMKDIPNESVDTFITSPPYFGQRDYDDTGQIGTEETIDEYIEKLQLIFNEVRRALKDTGTFFLNIGDKYINKGLQMIPEKMVLSMLNNGWILRNKIVWYKPNHMPTSVNDRFTNAWEPIYFFVKDTGMYYTQDYYSNINEIRIAHKTEEKEIDFPISLTEEEFSSPEFQEKLKEYNDTKRRNYKGKFRSNDKINKGQSPGARKSLGISYSKQRVNTINKELETEIIEYLRKNRTDKKIKIRDIDILFGYRDTAGHWFRLDNGRSLPKAEDWNSLKDILSLDNRYDNVMTDMHYVLQSVRNNEAGKNPGDVWEITLEKTSESHFATFPKELPYRIIKAFCPENGVVLDCFAGSGTTGVAAEMLGRNFILIELNKEYIEIIKRRINAFQKSTKVV